MYEAVKDNQPLVAEDRIIEPDTSLVEFSTSAVAVMEDVGTLQVKTIMKIFSLSKIFSTERMKMQIFGAFGRNNQTLVLCRYGIS